MKTMQPVLKLLFVVVLVGWALGRPMRAKADGTYYTCDAQWTNDYANLNAWMDQCMVCTHQGGPPNYQDCYTTPYSESAWALNPITGKYQYLDYTSSYQTCGDINESAEQCVNDCVYGFDEQFQSYWNADCQPI